MIAMILGFLKGLFVDVGMQLLERASEPEIKETESAFEESFTEPDVDTLLSDFNIVLHENDLSEAGTNAYT